VVRAYQWRWTEAEAEYRRAQELAPASAYLAWPFLVAQGRIEEGLVATRQALERDPLAPGAGLSAAWQHYLSRDYRAAIEQCQRTLDIAPDMQEALMLLAGSQARAGNAEAAAEANERWARAVGLPAEEVSALRASFAAHGLPGLWRFMLRLEERDEEVTGQTWPYRRAALHAQLGERDAAFRWLDAALAEQSPFTIYLGSDPAFDNLRGDPRFPGYLRRMNLDPEAFPKPPG
jgi:tetratricopeptide (TPR) repeat protein